MQPKKHTGILYDPLTLLHSCARQHPQRPQRVDSIIKHLKKENYLDHPRVDFIDKLIAIKPEHIKLAHSTQYINYVNTLWPEDFKKSHLMVLDTYFNKHSMKASELAAGGVIQGIQNIINKKWNNGFAIVRPPGHHSGFRKVINGFCVYNNVAIGVKYLQKYHSTKKILIFDWDVHHGDGTQHIFRNDPNVLFISLHRHDHGYFYPGESGSYENIGEKAKGFQINIPWNTCDQQYKSYKYKPGDNQYIYIYQRMLEPIIKQFQPEFIFISAGFDSARGDPLGDMNVGPDAYYYLTHKLNKIAPLLVVLQGGYNLKSISWAAESVVKALVGEQLTKQKSQAGLDIQEYKDLCHTLQNYHNDLDLIIKQFTQYWPILQTQKLANYEKLIKSNQKRVFGLITTQQQQQSDEQINQQDILKQIEKKNSVTLTTELDKKLSSIEQINPFTERSEARKKQHQTYQYHKKSSDEMQYYIAAGHVINFRFEDDKIYKFTKGRQIQFYNSDFLQKKFAPKYFGSQEKYIIMQNLLYDLDKPCVVDIKLGKPSAKANLSEQKMKLQEKKWNISSTGTLGFRIVAYVTPQRKQYGLLFKDEELIKKILRNVVDDNNKKQIVQFIQSMIKGLSIVNRIYCSTSLLIIKGKITKVNWIDFTYWNQNVKPDESLIWGLTNLATIINSI